MTEGGFSSRTIWVVETFSKITNPTFLISPSQSQTRHAAIFWGNFNKAAVLVIVLLHRGWAFSSQNLPQSWSARSPKIYKMKSLIVTSQRIHIRRRCCSGRNFKRFFENEIPANYDRSPFPLQDPLVKKIGDYQTLVYQCKFGCKYWKILMWCVFLTSTVQVYGIWWEPWPSGYGGRLMFQRPWVWILAPIARWSFFTLICCNNYIVCLKRPKISEKGTGDGPCKKTSGKGSDNFQVVNGSNLVLDEDPATLMSLMMPLELSFDLWSSAGDVVQVAVASHQYGVSFKSVERYK